MERRLGFEGFWRKLIWPLPLPNLNPLDLSIWMLIEERACTTPSPSVDVLKVRIKAEWVKFSEHYIRDYCTVFCHRLKACLETEGKVFQK